MDISQQIEAVYRRALLLKQYAAESPVPQDLLEKATQELYFVLEELQTSQEELHQQNQELLAARQSIEIERQRYQTLFELAPNGYLVTDLHGNIHQANQHAVDLLRGGLQEYLINKPLRVFVHEPDRPYFQAQLNNLTSKRTWEATLKSCKDTLITVAIAVTKIKATQGHKHHLLWSLTDISFHKQLE